jgi:predicted RND superfamily exporter protein
MEDKRKDFLTGLYRYPYLIVIVICAITVFFAFQLPKAELDNNNIRFIPEDDETRQTSRNIDEIFGSSLFILVGLERKYGDVFDASFLRRIEEFGARMKDFEIVGNINSLISSDYIFAEGDTIIVQKLAGNDFSLALTPAGISSLRQKVLSWDIYRHSLVSDDFKATQILIPLDISEEMAGRPELVGSFIEIRDIAREMFDGHAEVYVTGIPIISATINEAMRKDLVLMIPLVILVVLFVLFFSFRRITFVVLPLVTVLVAVVWSMGAMPLFDIKLSVISTVLPVTLVAVGSAYGIHIVTHYLENTKGSAEMSREEHFALILSIIRRIGKAVFLAALTTLVGFFSFCFTSVVPIREFSYFSTFGVLVSFLVAITLIPSLLIIRGPSHINKQAAVKRQTVPHSPLPGALEPVSSEWSIASIFSRITGRRGIIIFITIFVILFSVWGITKVILDNIFVEYFKTSTDISKSDRFIREKFGGSKIVSVVAMADSTEALLMPDVLAAMDNLGLYLEENVDEVGKVMGFTSLIKRINQVFNADESPDGLIGASSSGDEFDFDNFGFGEFGFATFDGENDNSANIDSRNKNAEAVSGQDGISAAELVALLREAASSGRDRLMDANTLVREMEKLINYEGASYYEIPVDPKRYGKETQEQLRQLIANYLILLSGNISSYANDPLIPTAIKTIIQLKTIGDKDTSKAINSIRGYIADNFPGTVNTFIGGSALVEGSLNRLVVQSQIISVFVSILIVFFIISLSNRSIVAGIIGISPLSICILINFAVMGFTGIKLNIGTSMVASVSVGIGIDYTIHYMEAFKREYRASGGKGDFLPKTFAASGKAILINAVSVGAGFAVLIFSQFIMLKHLGLLIALTMGSSALVSLTVLPVVLTKFNPKFIGKELN